MKLKFDVSGSDPEKATGSNYEPPAPGVYTVKINEIEAKDSKAGNPMLVVLCEITDEGKSKGAYMRDHITLSEAAAWKLDQFLQAFGVADANKRKGTLDTDLLLGKKAEVRIKSGEYNGAYSPSISQWMQLLEATADFEDDFDLGETVATDVPEDDEQDELPFGDEVTEEVATDDDYESMTVPALRAELESRGLVMQGARPALVARLRADDTSPLVY